MRNAQHTWVEATTADHDTTEYRFDEHWHNIIWYRYSTSNNNYSPADRYFYEANK